MLRAADLLRLILVPFLLVVGSPLGLLLAWLVVQRGVRDVVWRRRQTLLARYRPAVDAILRGGPAADAHARLGRTPARHLPIVADLLLAPLHATRGDVIRHARAAAAGIGLVDRWISNLRHRRWWIRAESVRALGFVEE